MKDILRPRLALTVLAALLVGMPLAQGQTPVPVIEEGGIRGAWAVADGTSLQAPGYPATFASQGDNVCVAMRYRINPDGSTSDFTMLRGWTSSTGEREPSAGFWDAFSSASAGALATWRFRPHPGGHARSVDTVATMTFVGKQATDAVALRTNCAVPDLVALMRTVHRQEWTRGYGPHRGAPARRAASDAREARQAASAYAATQR